MSGLKFRGLLMEDADWIAEAENDSLQLLGYLRFRAGRLPFPSLRFEEIIVDVNRKLWEASDALIEGIKGFKERYGYRGIFAAIPQTSSMMIDSLKRHGFKNTGAMKCYYFIDGYYVDVAVYGYP